MKKFLFISIGISIALCLGSIFLIQRGLYGCFWWECVSKRSFTVLDLQIPSNLFPPTSITNNISPHSESEGTIESGVQTIYWDQGNGVAVYQVFRYPTIMQASETFVIKKQLFSEPKSQHIWSNPTGIRDSFFANESYIGCGNWDEYRCGFVAQYDEYVVTFNTVIDSQMTLTSFEKAVIFIDNLFARQVYRKY